MGGMLFFAKVRDSKATVPRHELREMPKVKMIRRIIFRESDDQAYVRR